MPSLKDIQKQNVEECLSKTDAELLEELVFMDLGSKRRPVIDYILQTRRTAEIVNALSTLDKTIQKSATSSSRLGTIMVWLTGAIAFAALIGLFNVFEPVINFVWAVAVLISQ